MILNKFVVSDKTNLIVPSKKALHNVKHRGLKFAALFSQTDNLYTYKSDKYLTRVLFSNFFLCQW